MVQKNNFSTSNQFQKSLKVVGVSLSQSATKKHHHWCKYSYLVVLEFTTRWKPLVTLKNMQTKLDFTRKTLNDVTQFWKKHLWTDETKNLYLRLYNLYQSNGNRKALRRRKIAHNPNYIPSSVKSREGNVIACLAACRSRPLVFIDDVTSNRSSKIIPPEDLLFNHSLILWYKII